jgi:predicted enzyme related to lactoylglutathione lyase
MSSNPIVFWELASSDEKKSVNFFNKVFNWKLEFDVNLKFYTAAIPKEDNEFWGGGIFTIKNARHPFLTLYIKVDDIDSKIKEIEANGGSISEKPNDISENTRICLFNEPSGVTFAMIQKIPKK